MFLIWHKPRQALAGGALMAAQMSVTIAASEVVLRSGAISPPIHAAIVLVVILLAVLAPVLFGKLMPAAAPAEQPPVLIAGATPAAIRLARRVARIAPVLLADADPRKVNDARASGLAAVTADVTDPASLRKALGREIPRAVVAMTGNDQVNLAAARQATTALGVEQVLVFVTAPDLWEAARADRIGAFNPELAALDLAQNLLFSPAAADLLSDEPDTIGMFDVTLHNPAYSGHRLRDLQLPAAVLIAAVHRNGDKLIPNGDTALAAGDVLTVVGPTAEREDIQARFA